jgi:succinate dehydrogenase / fumarate reductase iron-sulfur subunit
MSTTSPAAPAATPPSAPETITIWIYRGTREEGQEQAYTVELAPGMVVLDAVHYVQAHHAPDLAVRWNCKAAHCGSCSAEVNGRPRLLCKTRLDEYIARGEPIHVRPMKTFPTVRDLVPDVSWNYEQARKIPAFQPRENAPFPLWQRDVDRIQEFRRCIECFLCQDVCHVLREHQGQDHYMGPRFMAKLGELVMNPEDERDRVPFVKQQAGVDWCNITHCCSEVCPESIEITNNAIIPLKERVADRYWDPLRALLRRPPRASS